MTPVFHRIYTVACLVLLTVSIPPVAAGQALKAEDAAALASELRQKITVLTSPSAITSHLEEKWEYSWNETDWKLEGNTVYVYDEYGRTESWRFRWNGTALVNETRTKTTPGGTSFTLTVNEVWDAQSAGFQPVDQVRDEYVYDFSTGEPAVSKSEFQTWNGSGWENAERSTYTYGDNLTLIGGQDDVWDAGAWVPKSRYKVMQEGDDVHIVDQEWEGATWVTTERTIFRGLTIKDLQKRLVQIESELLDFEEMMYGLHLIPDSEGQEFDGANWVNTYRQIREYDYQAGNFGAVIYESWVEDQWVPITRYALSWESPSILSSMTLDYYDGESWQTFASESYDHDDQGSIKDVTQQDDLGEGLVNSARYLLLWKHVGSDSENDDLPSEFGLDPAYPNPFNPATQVTYHLAASAQVSLRVFDVLGRQVATLTEGVRSAGSHTITFEGSNLPSGQYIVRLDAPGFTESRVVTLLK